MKISVLLFILLHQVISRKLVFIQNLFRHGARYPTFINDQDNTSQPHIKNYAGQLTTQGKNMHYVLGKVLHKKYWKALFQGTQAEFKYDHRQIYVKSTNFNRTIESVESQLRGWLQNLQPLTLQPKDAGFSFPAFQNLSDYIDLNYTKNKWFVFNQLEKYQPIPIHTSSAGENTTSSNPYEQGDFLIKFSQLDCPNQVKWADQNYNSTMGKHIANMPQVKQAIKKLSQAFPSRQVTIRNAFVFVDSYDCMKYLGQKTLDIFEDPKYERTFKYISQFTLYLSNFYQPIQYQATATGLFQTMVQNFKNAINNTGPKLILYSGHDTTVGLALATMNLTNIECINDKYLNNASNEQTCVSDYPPFASNFIIEIYKQDNNTHTFQIVFNNIQRRIPFCDMKFACPVERFYDWVDSWKIQDPNKQCGITSQKQQEQISIQNQKKQIGKLFMIISIQLVVIIVLAVFVYHEYMKQRKQKLKITQYMTSFQKHQHQDVKQSN